MPGGLAGVGWAEESLAPMLLMIQQKIGWACWFAWQELSKDNSRSTRGLLGAWLPTDPYCYLPRMLLAKADLEVSPHSRGLEVTSAFRIHILPGCLCSGLC